MPTVYIETSVVSHLTARPRRDVVTLARQELTREWWNTRRHRHDLFTPDVVIGEAREGDDEADQRWLEALQGLGKQEATSEAEGLAAALLEEGSLPEKRPSMLYTLPFLRPRGSSTSSPGTVHPLPTQRCENRSRRCRTRDAEAPIMCTPEELMEE